MKRFLCVLLACLMVTPAFADQFVDDFNDYTGLYGIENLTFFMSDDQVTYYTCGKAMVSYSDNMVTIMSEDALDVITVSCCVLRCVDNSGSMIDQYGRLLHAYYLHKTGTEQATATTVSGTHIFFTTIDGLFCVGVMK